MRPAFPGMVSRITLLDHFSRSGHAFLARLKTTTLFSLGGASFGAHGAGVTPLRAAASSLIDDNAYVVGLELEHPFVEPIHGPLMRAAPPGCSACAACMRAHTCSAPATSHYVVCGSTRCVNTGYSKMGKRHRVPGPRSQSFSFLHNRPARPEMQLDKSDEIGTSPEAPSGRRTSPRAQYGEPGRR